MKAVELHAAPLIIFRLMQAAAEDLNRVRASDLKHGLKRRITLAMTHSEATFRKYAESQKSGEKVRWPKRVKPNTVGYAYKDDGTSVFSERFGKFPFFIRCVSCQKTMMDTEIASLPHLRCCGLKGFMTYHSQKVMDDPVVSENDRRIFNWKESAEQAVEDFHPTITTTVDGYGRRNVEKKSRQRVDALVKKVEPVNGYRAKTLVVRDEEADVSGSLRIVGTINDQVKLKRDLTRRVVNLSSFSSEVKKRKMTLNVEENLQRKCTRRTSTRDLLFEPYCEYLRAEIERMEEEQRMEQEN